MEEAILLRAPGLRHGTGNPQNRHGRVQANVGVSSEP